MSKGKLKNVATSTSNQIDELWREYRTLVGALREQGRHRDIALEMRLRVVMMDLGLYQPSPP